MTDNSVLDALINDAELGPSQLSEKQLGDIAVQCNAIMKLEEVIEDLETKVKENKALLLKLSTEMIPETLDELGLSEVTLSDGTKVSLSNFYSCSIKEDKKAAAMNWLRNNDLGDVIKTEVVVPFGKGDVKQAEKTSSEILKKLKLKSTVTYSVHAQTLKKLAREQHEAGKSLPESSFNLYIGRITKLKKV